MLWICLCSSTMCLCNARLATVSENCSLPCTLFAVQNNQGNQVIAVAPQQPAQPRARPLPASAGNRVIRRVHTTLSKGIASAPADLFLTNTRKLLFGGLKTVPRANVATSMSICRQLSSTLQLLGWRQRKHEEAELPFLPFLPWILPSELFDFQSASCPTSRIAGWAAHNSRLMAVWLSVRGHLSYSSNCAAPPVWPPWQSNRPSWFPNWKTCYCMSPRTTEPQPVRCSLWFQNNYTYSNHLNKQIITYY